MRKRSAVFHFHAGVPALVRFVQCQEAAQDLSVGKLRGVIDPAIGGGNGPVQLRLAECQAGGLFVVEVGQGAFLPGRGMFRFGDRPGRETGLLLFRRDLPVEPALRIEPLFPPGREVRCSGGDDSKGITFRGGLGMKVESGREGEGLKGKAGVVTGIGAQSLASHFCNANTVDA